MDVKKSHKKYQKLLNFLRKRNLATTLREKKGILPYSIVEDAHRKIHITFNEESVKKLDSTLRKHWKKICNDVQISNADSIVTISKVICDARKKDAYEIAKKYIIKTRDADFLNGDVNLSLIRNALMKHRGVDFIKYGELSHCRAQVQENYKEIRQAIVNKQFIKSSKDENSHVDSNCSEVSDFCLEPTNPVAYSPVAGTSKELNYSFEEQTVEIKREAITGNERSALGNELLSPIREIVIPLERVRVPPKKKSPEQQSEKYFSRWLGMISDEEYLHSKKKDFLSQFQQEKLKLVNTFQGAVQEFFDECDKAVDELFDDIRRKYRKRLHIKRV